MNQRLVLVVILGLLLSACSGNTSPTPTPVATPGATATPLPPEGNLRSFTVEGKNFSYNLKEIRVKLGDTVQLTFKNLEGFHDWRVDEFNVFTKQLGANQQDSITFVANQRGTFEFYCSVGQHRAMGMVGKLIVE